MSKLSKRFARESSKGFTLIELLVVIAIIGILAALVLVALGNARQKANDARIKSNLGQLRTLAEVHYDASSATYDGFGDCVEATDPAASADCNGEIGDDVSSLKSDTSDAGGEITADDDTAQNFCIESHLNSDTNTFVCVDATGQFVENTGTGVCLAASDDGVCS